MADCTRELHFTTPKISFSLTFWETLAKLKAAKWGIENPVVEICATVPSLAKPFGRPHFVRLDESSFANGFVDDAFCLCGELQNFGSLDLFRAVNRDGQVDPLIRDKLLAPVLGGTQDTWDKLLFLFVRIITFVDLKHSVFYHTACFPYVQLNDPVRIKRRSIGHREPLSDRMSMDTLNAVCAEVVKRRFSPFLFIEKEEDCFVELSATTLAHALAEKRYFIACLSHFLVGDVDSNPTVFPSTAANILTAVRLALPTLDSLCILAITSGGPSSCIFVEAEFNAYANLSESQRKLVGGGWQTSETPPMDLASHLSAEKLAEENSRLNLELLRWRSVPELNLDALSFSRALLLGMGTLGCHVALNLASWGIRHLTLVDNGRVSYSNIFRQTLYTTEDAACGKKKCEAAMAALKRMLPSLDVSISELTIPMPGHRTDDKHAAQTRSSILELSNLVLSHDVVFILLDSKEARWVPTVLCTAHDKPVINVALGIHSFTVMRHGMRTTEGDEKDQLGCYFCDTDTPPKDSTTSRDLDQQCTVSRPGVGAIASALAVEMFAQLTHSERKFREPHGAHTALGAAPHMLRGSVYLHSISHTKCCRNPHCTACCDRVVAQFTSRGADFILECVQDPDYISQVASHGKPLSKESVEPITMLEAWDSLGD